MRYHNLLFALFILAAARPLRDPSTYPRPASRWGDKSLKHAWHVIPAGWESPVTPPASVTIDLSISLKPHDENALIDALYEVSNPGLPKYGAYLSKEKVAELVAPHPDAFEVVHAWLEHHGIPSSSISTSHGGNWLTLTRVPLSKANDLLSASYQYFLHAETNETILRTLSYAIPTVLHEHVRTIVPTTFFGSGAPEMPKQTPQVHHSDVTAARTKAKSGEPVIELSSRNFFVNPSLLRWMHNTVAYIPSAVDKNVLGTVGFRGLTASQADLSTFTANYLPGGDDANYVVVMISGTQYNSKNPSPQQNLDVQYATAMSYPTPQLYYSISSTSDPFVTWFGYILKQKHIPQTISTTYGVAEQIVPLDYALGVCLLFAQLAARGVSVLYPSGNFGVGKGDCKVKDGSGNDHVEFRPTFPATCPFVTAVGGTTGLVSETGARLSGGGFSTVFARPPYQATVVPNYLRNLGDQYEGLFSAGGRGIPDISAQALRYVSITNGQTVYRDGTNCATPTVAGIISLLNDYQLSVDQPPLGFLNPWLYGGGLDGLNDIASGTNPGCNTGGFSAAVGWDPVTGLGTLNFEKLVLLLPDSPD
ncbi:subtilisin-like protein [Lactarius quietus]|nr:subtilisin-like protein [Lactarius quietus]